MKQLKRFFKDLWVVIRWPLNRINLGAAAMWTVGGIIAAVVYILIVFGVVAAFGSCATKKELHEHQTHVVEADTLAREAKHEGHAQQTAVNLDSIVTASVWAAMQEFVKSEQEHEVTTETLTETIDSLGRIIRQQQRTTDRTLSRQELQRQEQQLQQLSIDLKKHIESLDSLWSERVSSIETHLRDSLSAQLDKQSVSEAPKAATWLQKAWSWLKGILIGIVIGVFAVAGKRLWSIFRNLIRKQV